MLPYFPLTGDKYQLTMDAQAGLASLIEVEPDKYHAELALKSVIIASNPAYYVQCPPDAEALAWEMLEALLPDMATNLPQYFALQREENRWAWTNHLLNTTTAFTLGDASTLPLPPLVWMGRQVQEDLILMREGAAGEAICAAGHLCFGSAWCLNDKMGVSFLNIHEDVPGFREQVGVPSDLLMRRLKPNRSVARLNWSVTCNDQLNLAPILASEWHKNRYGITLGNADNRFFFRVERQTLTRLPHTRGILFTIHTYLNPLEDVICDPFRLRRLAAVLHDYPNALKIYKGMTPYFNTLLAYLDARLSP